MGWLRSELFSSTPQRGATSSVDSGAGEHAGFDGFVECGMDPGQKFDRLRPFCRPVSSVRNLFPDGASANSGAAIMLVFALVAARPAFG